MDFLKKLSEQFSLTRTEVRVILVLIITLLFGSVLKIFIMPQKAGLIKEFDYSRQDSLFNAGNYSSGEDNPGSDKEVDYKAEVLDFNKSNFETDTKKVEPAEKSININTAGVPVLINLPGIGVKTAQNIISFREKRGSIKKIDELLEVKGIGKAKLNKISKYLFVN